MKGMAPERSVLLTSSDADLRKRLRSTLIGLRWQVREASGGAEAIAVLEEEPTGALLLDRWLPDLETGALAEILVKEYPHLELIRFDGTSGNPSQCSPYRNELLHALRDLDQVGLSSVSPFDVTFTSQVTSYERQLSEKEEVALPSEISFKSIPGLVGGSAAMRELTRLIRLVAPHTARVLIEGETGTGKELVAKALHQLSTRAKKPLIVLNCAAIPEALLEAELFGHTRGAFTGALQARVGRIEAAHGGTLFLDDIGEMPVALQAKLLRFLENGELQRIGENEPVRADVRVISATHKNLDDSVLGNSFRLDLLHRLAVFPIEVPSLRERLDDLPLLAEHFLEQMAQEMPRKRLRRDAYERLEAHHWPGNVRELGHVLQRAAILAGDCAEISANEIRVRRSPR